MIPPAPNNEALSARPPAVAPEPPRPRRRRRIAAALRYVSGQTRFPVVVATGHGAVAERILDLARRSGVPVAADADLAETLARLDLGEAIPPEAIAAVAAILLPILTRTRPSRGRP
ncbi:protein of unknown function (plasmid) [Rhodovastum atsumiense]|uniref:EscU/YscU/HrcU family type III secretion system export apparatus switch protein n=1 Tax=Rhodovastum atsumiense TaxID=504468 RepID=UPI002024648F|nr:EscU/YscU/HrcU family type III secretion system export apparatus switch protein [Rhodovastum atsumiense]CAH2605528.1 protein of unknown function [Rhodovastum atsumiense]